MAFMLLPLPGLRGRSPARAQATAGGTGQVETSRLAAPLPRPSPASGGGRLPAPCRVSPFAASIHVLLIAALLLELVHEGDRLVAGARTVLCDDVDQRALDVLGHALGVAADIDVGALGQPRPQVA